MKMLKREDPQKIKNLYRRVFATADGKALLQDMEASFGGNTFDSDTNTSMYKQGQRSVVDAIKKILED